MYDKGVEIVLNDIKEKTGKEVVLKDLDKFLRANKSVVAIKLKIGWRRTNISLSNKQLGINPKDEEMMEFVKEHFRSGKISIIPDKYNSKLRTLESGTRQFVKANSIDDGQTIPTAKLDRFLEKFEENKKEFFKIRDEICLIYGTIVEETLLKLEIMFRDMGIEEEDKEKFMKNISRKIPTEEKFYNSFTFDYIPEMFPQLYTGIIGDDGQEEYMKKFIKDTFEVSLNLAINTANNIMIKIEKDGFLKPKTVEQIDNTIKALEENNIFYSKEIEQVINLFRETKTTEDQEEKAEIAEEILASIYGIDEKLGIELDYGITDYSEAELKAIYSTMVA